MSGKNLSVVCGRSLHEEVLVPAPMYGCETQVLQPYIEHNTAHDNFVVMVELQR